MMTQSMGVDMREAKKTISLWSVLSSIIKARANFGQTVNLLIEKHGRLSFLPFRVGLLVSSAEISEAIQRKPSEIRKVDFIHWIDPFRNNAVAQNGEAWERSKRNMVRAFSPVAVTKLYSGTIAAQVDLFLDFLGEKANDQFYDMSSAMERWVFDTLSVLTFGVNPNTLQGDNLDYFRALLSDTAGGVLIPVFFWKTFGAAKRIRTFVDECYTKCLSDFESYPDCALKEMIKINASTEEGMTLSAREIQDNLVAVYRAGQGGLASIASWLLSTIGFHKNAQERCRREAVGLTSVPSREHLKNSPYVSAVVKEINRLWPPVPFLFPRMMDSKIEGPDFEIPARKLLLVWLPLIQRDPELWGADALTFNPDRFLKESLSYKRAESHATMTFGTGQRSCPGSSLTVTILEFLLIKLVARYQIDSRGDGLSASEANQVRPGKGFISSPKPLRIKVKAAKTMDVIFSAGA